MPRETLTAATVTLAAAPATTRSRSRLFRRLMAITIGLLAMAGVTGCGDILDDYSPTTRSLPNSINLDAGPLALRHLRIELRDPVATGGSTAVLRGSFLNLGTQPDALLRTTTSAAATMTLTSGDRVYDTVALPAGRVARLQHPEDPGWVLHDLRRPLAAGSSVDVTFHFASQGRVTAQIPVAGA